MAAHAPRVTTGRSLSVMQGTGLPRAGLVLLIGCFASAFDTASTNHTGIAGFCVNAEW